MTIKLTLLIKLLLTTSICYVIEKQLHDTPQETSHQKVQSNATFNKTTASTLFQ